MTAITITAEQALSTLREKPPRGSMLSIYLDTSPNKMEHQAHRLSMLAGCKRLRGSIPPAERAAFEAAIERAERYLDAEFSPHARGIAIFVSGESDELLAVGLPRSPIEKVSWGRAARIEPLQAITEEFERVAVVLLDKERSRIFTIFLGEIEEQQAFRDHVPRKQATGGWFALAQTRLARRHDEHVRQHIERTVAVLMDLLESRPFDRLIIGGPDEAVAVLKEHLPGPLRVRLAGALRLELFAGNAEVLREALKLAERAERRAELAEVHALLDAASSRHVALGIDETMAALSDGRVHALFIADAFVGTGGECPSCGLLVARGAQCPRCEAPVTMVRDLRERIAEQALNQAARVEVVSGDAGATLLQHGGVAAWTRY